jgi:hypothetical protein
MDDTECLICLEEFELSPIAVLSCNHKYHFNCLTKWINTRTNKYNICTVCNKNVEIVNVYSANQNFNNPISIPSHPSQPSPPTQQPEEPITRQTRQTGIFSCCTIL